MQDGRKGTCTKEEKKKGRERVTREWKKDWKKRGKESRGMGRKGEEMEGKRKKGI